MVILKVRKTWQHTGATPLFRALVLDGALYYCGFILAFGLETFATASSEVSKLHHVQQTLTRMT